MQMSGEVVVESMSYGAALKELETILREIEDERVDLDELGARVERAAVLIRVCRDKIARTEAQVKRILASEEDEGEAV
jgi:exodeoxyribonuclease VII small subunit